MLLVVVGIYWIVAFVKPFLPSTRVDPCKLHNLYWHSFSPPCPPLLYKTRWTVPILGRVHSVDRRGQYVTCTVQCDFFFLFLYLLMQIYFAITTRRRCGAEVARMVREMTNFTFDWSHDQWIITLVDVCSCSSCCVISCCDNLLFFSFFFLHPCYKKNRNLHIYININCTLARY